jgi:hypothetical protein
MQSISPEMYPQLLNIINEACSNCIESILSAGLDGNNDIVCCAQGGGDQLTITIEDEHDSILILSNYTQEIQKFGVIQSTEIPQQHL